MQKTLQLLIRACKSLDPEKRLKSVYRRFYLSHMNDGEYMKSAITSIIGGIIDKHFNGFSSAEILSLQNSILNNEQEIQDRILNMFVDKIRYTQVDRLTEIGYITPLKFRRNI